MTSKYAMKSNVRYDKKKGVITSKVRLSQQVSVISECLVNVRITNIFVNDVFVTDVFVMDVSITALYVVTVTAVRRTREGLLAVWVSRHMVATRSVASLASCCLARSVSVTWRVYWLEPLLHFTFTGHLIYIHERNVDNGL